MQLQFYEHKEVIQFLKYGFPVDCKRGYGSSEVPRNHKGAREFPKQVQELLNKEVSLGGTLGPFEVSPFNEPNFSPLNSVPKKGSGNAARRLILDLSMPAGKSVNDGIDKDIYLGKMAKLQLPSIDEMVERIVSIGDKARLFKVDLSRAYKQMYIDPIDIERMGFVHEGSMYFDCTLSMFSRSSTRCCQMVTSVVVYIFCNNNYFAINYLDDLGGVQEVSTAEEAYSALKRLLRDFGLKEAIDKSCPPSHCMVFLGIEVNSILFTHPSGQVS